MDIDAVARFVDAPSRRAVLATLSASVLATLASLVNPGGPQAKKKGKKKKGKHGPSLRLAYECAAPPEGFDLYPSGRRMAQTFVAGRSGTLRRVQFAISKQAGSSGDWLVHFLAAGDDNPSNSPLRIRAAAAIPDAIVPDGESVLTANFAGPGPVLEAGTEYAVAIWREEDSLGLGYHYHTNGNTCAGGQFSANGAGAFSSFIEGEYDLVVSVFVD